MTSIDVLFCMYVCGQRDSGHVVMVCGQRRPPLFTSAGRTVLVNLVINHPNRPPSAGVGNAGYGFTLSYKTACACSVFAAVVILSYTRTRIGTKIITLLNLM